MNAKAPSGGKWKHLMPQVSDLSSSRTRMGVVGRQIWTSPASKYYTDRPVDYFSLLTMPPQVVQHGMKVPVYAGVAESWKTCVSISGYDMVHAIYNMRHGLGALSNIIHRTHYYFLSLPFDLLACNMLEIDSHEVPPKKKSYLGQGKSAVEKEGKESISRVRVCFFDSLFSCLCVVPHSHNTRLLP